MTQRILPTSATACQPYSHPLLGRMLLIASAHALVEVRFSREMPPDIPVQETPLLWEAGRQLAAYADGRLRAFDLPLAPCGTSFQHAVWRALLDIPFGQTRSYGEVAASLGRPRAARAVGMACHRNPVAIIIPCHRVIGASGQLTGYAGGLDIKARLLALERLNRVPAAR